ncbi:MAG: hypothetical protein J6040_04175 [Clostridiales bacterium]|nr:hypothetical protein [Clostridiales bacterium]
MSDATLISVILSVIQVVVLIAVILPTARAMLSGKTTLISVFFCFAMGCYLFSDLYWVAYDCLRPDTRMPFAVNEFSECAMILFLSAGLEKVLKDERKVAWEIIFSFAFIGANIALWILWSGEWVQDILFGIPYVYFLWLLIRGIKSRDLLPKIERAGIVLLNFLILALEFVALYSEKMDKTMNIPIAILTFGGLAWLLIRSIKTKDVFLAFAFFFSSIMAMYSFADLFYNLATAANTVALPLMYFSMKKERDKDDLR